MTDAELETDLVVRRLGRRRGEAPTMVFLHGLTDSGAGWPGAVDHWGDHYSIITVDARGHGDSPRFTQEQLEAHPGDVMVEDTIGLLEQLGEAPVLIGHSLGGAVAWATAVRRPDLVRALVLEDPAPLGPGDEQRDPSRGKEFLAGVQDSISAGDDMSALVGMRREKHPTWPEEELRVTGIAEQQMDTDYLAHGDFKPSTRWPELVKELILPALLVTGGNLDEVVVDEAFERGITEVGNPNVTVVRIPGAGHCIRREQPERFYDVVDAFLTAH